MDPLDRRWQPLYQKTLDENVKSLKDDNKRTEAEFKDIRKRLEAIEAPPLKQARVNQLKSEIHSTVILVIMTIMTMISLNGASLSPRWT